MRPFARFAVAALFAFSACTGDELRSDTGRRGKVEFIVDDCGVEPACNVSAPTAVGASLDVRLKSLDNTIIARDLRVKASKPYATVSEIANGWRAACTAEGTYDLLVVRGAADEEVDVIGAECARTVKIAAVDETPPQVPQHEIKLNSEGVDFLIVGPVSRTYRIRVAALDRKNRLLYGAQRFAVNANTATLNDDARNGTLWISGTAAVIDVTFTPAGAAQPTFKLRRRAT